jgi:hypothetical protein
LIFVNNLVRCPLNLRSVDERLAQVARMYMVTRE